MRKVTNLTKILLLLIFVVSFFLSFIVAEYLYRYILEMNSKDIYSIRTMLFQKGDNFKNIDDYFSYYPNKNIRSATIYSKKSPKNLSDIVIEYDYYIETNNAGLVMRNDINNGDDVILVIGDSLTEGQGASPWFYDLENNFIGVEKIINLGLLGTGPIQWEKIAKHVINEYNLNVKGVIINIIIPDLIRDLWNFNPTELDCLRSGFCDYYGSFHGVEFAKLKNKTEIKKYILEKSQLSNPLKQYDGFMKQALSHSKIVMDLYKFIIASSDNHKQNIAYKNFSAILKLFNLSNEKFHLNIINTKNTDDFLLNELLNLLNSKNLEFANCLISENGFHKYDSHPNEKGYEVLKKCTYDSIEFIGY